MPAQGENSVESLAEMGRRLSALGMAYRRLSEKMQNKGVKPFPADHTLGAERAMEKIEQHFAEVDRLSRFLPPRR